MRPIDRVNETFRELQALSASIQLLNWDQQVLMPSGGSTARAEHIGRLRKFEHQKLTSDELAKDVQAALADSDEFEEAHLIVLSKDIAKARKLPEDLVVRKGKAGAAAYQQWRISKPISDTAAMIPHLTTMFDLAKETAEALGYQNHPYDPLIDQFEEGSTHAEAKRVLGALQDPSKKLIAAISELGDPIDDRFLVRDWDQPRLRMAMMRVISQIGFDFDAGRLDISNNAFCTSPAIDDVRMTTRPSDHIKGIVSSSLHEMGHALYEQFQRHDWAQSALRGGVSLAVHESQSRTWENVIGRSRMFWNFFFPWFQEQFRFLSDISNEQFYRAYNRVYPDPIRVGSDELHYNLHILLRFEMESAIVEGSLAVRDLPEAWNEKFHDLFGTYPASHAEGCLQDVHWTKGSIGYFPTYSYGNLIGVQFWNQLKSEVPNAESAMAEGNFRPILEWLAEKVYGYGRLMPPKVLLKHVTGDDLNPQPWLDYAQVKFADIYHLE